MPPALTAHVIGSADDKEPQRRVPLEMTEVKRGNLYAEQDQIGSDSGVARSNCNYISIGTGKVA